MKSFALLSLIIMGCSIQSTNAFQTSSLRLIKSSRIYAAKDNQKDVDKLINDFVAKKIDPVEFEKKIILEEVNIKAQRSKQEQETLLATVAGGAIIGLFLGTISDLGLVDANIPAYALPSFFSLALSGASFYAAAEASPEVNKIAISYVGKPTLRARDKLVAMIFNASTSTLKRMENKKDKTIADIKNIPSLIKTSILQSIERTKTNIKNKIVSFSLFL